MPASSVHSHIVGLAVVKEFLRVDSPIEDEAEKPSTGKYE